MRAARVAHVSEPRPVQVIPVVYDLIVWSSAKVGAFPRKHRFTIGDRLISAQLDTLALLIGAQFTPARRTETLREANLALEQLRYLFRLAKDLQCLSLDEFEFAAIKLVEAGKMVGGWARHATRRAATDGSPASGPFAGAPASPRRTAHPSDFPDADGP